MRASSTARGAGRAPDVFRVAVVAVVASTDSPEKKALQPLSARATRPIAAAARVECKNDRTRKT